LTCGLRPATATPPGFRTPRNVRSSLRDARTSLSPQSTYHLPINGIGAWHGCCSMVASR
jgi:hypothetical protein